MANDTRCERRTLAQLQAELDELVAAGVLEPVVDGDGVTRYQRAGATA